MLRLERNPLGLLILAAILLRIGFAFAYGSPVAYNDTRSYEVLASMLARGDLSGHDGIRTPVYPLLMLLCGQNPTVLVVLQMALGVLTSVILYAAFLGLTGNRRLAFAVGLSHSLNFSQLLFESNLLTETSSTFLLSLALLQLFGVAGLGGRPPSWRRALAAGALGSLATLDRPLCLLLPLLGGVYLGVRALGARIGARRKLARVGLAYSLPVLLLLGGWSWVNERTTGFFTISTLTGMNLTHWSGAYIESAPSEYRTIQEVYIPYRDRAGTSALTIWRARAELLQRTGLTDAQLSRTLQKMSIAIIARHPGAYGRQVARSWFEYWRPPLMRRGVHLQPILALISRGAIAALEFVFLLAPLAWALSRRVRARVPHPLEFGLIYALVLGTSVTQALLISVENSRYSAVLAPWSLGTAICCLWGLGGTWKRHRTLGAVSRRRIDGGPQSCP